MKGQLIRATEHIVEHFRRHRFGECIHALQMGTVGLICCGRAVLAGSSLTKQTLFIIHLGSDASWAMGSSHFDHDACAIHLAKADSFVDDNGMFTVLHEMGHVMDFMTDDGSFRMEESRGKHDIKHGGYANESSADSFGEGFATFYLECVSKRLLGINVEYIQRCNT